MIQYKNLGVTVSFTGEHRKLRPEETSFRRPRVALYSHDTMGLGHIRRNLLIAQALSRSALRPQTLLITGARHARSFLLPYAVSCLILPPFHKDSSGEYRPEYPGARLQTLIDFRSSAIRAAIERFDPDLLIVDKVPRGALRELDSTLEFLRSRKTHCILGLRDVLDSPQIVQREWKDDSFEEIVREYYHSIWVYGDPNVYDTAREYKFPSDIAKRILYTGYHDQRCRLQWVCPSKETVPYILCMVGGGQDGSRLAETFARCTLPDQIRRIVIAGPLMPGRERRRLERFALKDPSFKVIDFMEEPASLIAQAESIVAMGGYNTVCEVLSHEKPALIVPRDTPRREQLIRAERMKEMGLLDFLHPENATRGAVLDWLQKQKIPPRVHGRIDMGGLQKIPDYISSHLSTPKNHYQPCLVGD